MKKIIIVAALLSVSLMGCNNNNSSNGGGNTNYTNTNLENSIITFLNGRGVTSLNRVEPLHYISDTDVDSVASYPETVDDYAYMEARISSTDIVNEVLNSCTSYSWTTFYDSTYEIWCAVDPNNLVEIDVQYETGTYLGTWIYAYSYDDLYGSGGGGGGDVDDYIDIGNATTVTFSSLGLTNAEQYPAFVGDNISIFFGDGENDGKYYNTGSGIRIYGNGYVAIQSNVSQNIKQIVFTWDTYDDRKPDSADVANVGTYNVSTATWTGSAEVVELTRPDGSGHWRLQSVAVTLG